jgi:hypothetical protein
MTIQSLQLTPSLEQPQGKCGSGAVGSRPRPYGLAQTLALLLAGLLLLGCEADGVPGNPLGIKLQWFSFLDGDDFKRQCDAGEPDRYRLIYNARFEEQVRVYDVTQYGDEAILRARAVAPGFVLTATRDSLDFGWQESKARLTPAEFAEFKRRLQQSGFFAPTPVGLELYSPDFYWVGMSCEDGAFHYTAFARPSPEFEALTFPEFLFDHDETGLRVNPPRDIPVSERLRAKGGGMGPVRERGQSPAFRMVVDEDGIAGDYGLL